MVRRLFLALALVLFWGAGLGPGMSFVPVSAFAQDNVFPADDPVIQGARLMGKAQQALDKITSDLPKNSENDRELIKTKDQLDDILGQLGAFRAILTPRQDDIAERLKQLGDAPKEGQPAESVEVTQQRNKLGAQKNQLAAYLGQLDDLIKAARDLSAKTTSARRALFTRQLFAHTDVTLDTFSQAFSALGPETERFSTLIGGWAGFAWRFKKVQLATAILLSLGLALGLRYMLHKLFGPLINRARLEENPTYMSRFSLAFWATIAPSLAFTFFVVASFFFLDTFNVLRPDIRPIIGSVLGGLGVVYFVSRLAIGVFHPKAPKWRLVRVSTRGARQLVLALVAMSAMNMLDYVIASITEVLGSPIELTVLKGFTSSTLVGLILLAVSFIRPLEAKAGIKAERESARVDSEGAQAEETVTALPEQAWPKRTRYAMRIFAVGIILSAMIGYIGLARFIATQLILTGGVIATIYIGIRSGRAVSERDRFAETVVGRYLQRRYDLGAVALDQLGIAAGLFIYAFALAVGVPLILMSWGFQPPDIQTWFYNLFIQINIGGMSISILGIFTGATVFLIGLVFTRWFEKWLDGNVMARSQVDPGVRNSVKTSVGYFGAIIAGLIALSIAGINLSSLALVAGALSVGIGFGLQNIISNFVSGLILLVERPFKVGDWVATGTSEGFVRRISVRATEIETFQRQSIIVPNSQLINASVGNWTHRNKLGRIDITVTAKSANDPRQIMQLLKDVASNIQGVLRNPEPVVIFKDFDGADLTFEVRVFVADILTGVSVRNELRVSIFERFREHAVVMSDPAEEV